MLARRKFLGALLATPMAAPVIAKEAAISMGLAGVVGQSTALMGGAATESGGVPLGATPEDYVTYLRRELSELSSGQSDPDMRQTACYQARCLDSDLASMRSVSPAFAYRRQQDRCYARAVEERRSRLLKNLAKYTGL